jgi:hypothetical protein
MVAMVAAELLQVVPFEVTSLVVPSVKVAVALNCWVAPTAMLAVAGVTPTELTVFVVDCTVRAAEPVIPSSEADTVTAPSAFAVTSPVLFTDAIDPEFTVHAAVELTLALEPSVYFAVAVNCSVCPVWTLAVCGDTAIADRVFVPPELLVLETPPHPIPANVRARVEVVKTEVSTKRREAFIFLLLYGY